jgi:hypothetical protein
MTKRRKKKQKRSLSDKGDNSSCINNNSPTSTNDQMVNMNHSINPGFQSNTSVSYQRGIIQ